MKNETWKKNKMSNCVVRITFASSQCTLAKIQVSIGTHTYLRLFEWTTKYVLHILEKLGFLNILCSSYLSVIITDIFLSCKEMKIKL